MSHHKTPAELREKTTRFHITQTMGTLPQQKRLLHGRLFKGRRKKFRAR